MHLFMAISGKTLDKEFHGMSEENNLTESVTWIIWALGLQNAWNNQKTNTNSIEFIFFFVKR